MKTKEITGRKGAAQWENVRSYRLPMQIRLYMRHWRRDCYPICPRCESSLERDFLNYCYHCGQRLGWDRLDEVCFITAGDRDRKIRGKRKICLSVTRDEATERLYITVPGTEGEDRPGIPGRKRRMG